MCERLRTSVWVWVWVSECVGVCACPEIKLKLMHGESDLGAQSERVQHRGVLDKVVYCTCVRESD